jgi:hypothetical protein
MNANQSIATGKLLWVAPAVAAIAAVVNVVVFFILSLFVDWNATMTPAGAPVSAVPVAMLTFIPILLAGVVFFLLARFTQRPATLWIWVCVAVTVVSFVTPFTVPGAPLPWVIGLEVLHIVAGAVAAIGYPRLARA